MTGLDVDNVDVHDNGENSVRGNDSPTVAFRVGGGFQTDNASAIAVNEIDVMWG